MNDYWDDDSQYDQVADELKQAFRESVKDEIKNRIKKLVTENRELKVKLEGLDRLELEAAQSKAKYDREYSSAKREAQQAARKEKLADLLTALDERLYSVEIKYVKNEKCAKCDENRRLHYVTPRGKPALEACECSGSTRLWEATEVAAHEVSSRDGKLLIWWAAVSRWADSDSLNAKVLKRSEGVPAEKLAANPNAYSYKDRASAQATADAANERKS
jgi:regulator of replication initiation timing